MKNINKRLIQQTKLLLKGQQADGYFIWKCMEDQDEIESTNVYYYCMKLFENLIVTQKKLQTLEHHQAMLSTLLILEFYKNMKEKHQSFLSSARELFTQNHMKLHQHAEWVIDLFLKPTGESSFPGEFISRLCHAPKTLSWKVQPGREFDDSIQQAQIYYRQLQIQKNKVQKIHKPLKHTSYPTQFIESKIISLGYVCFIDYLRSANLQMPKELYKHMLDLMKGFVHAVRVTEKVIQLFLSLLFLIKNMLTFYGCMYDDIMKEMAYQLTIVRNWPGVIGCFAAQVFQVIHGQLKCKGTAFRRKLRYDYPSLDMKMAQSLQKKVIVLSNVPGLYNTPTSISLTNLRKLLIYNIFGCCDSDNSQRYFKSLQLIDSQLTYNTYYKLSRLIDMTMVVQSYSQLSTLQKQSIPELIKYNPLVKGKVPKDQLQQLQQIVNHQHELKFFSYPQCELVQVKIQNLENKKHVNSMYQLFENIKLGASELFYQGKVAMMMHGDDYEISRWLRVVVAFMEELPVELLQKLQIYLLPSKKFSSSIAQYLSLKDLWYRRFVYNIFHEKVLYPDVDFAQNNTDIFPHYLLNKSLQMYIRQAERIFPVQVFKCILRMSQVDHQQVVYFTSHILIGASAEVEIMKSNQQDKTKRSTSNDGIQLYLERIKKPPLIMVDIHVSHRQSLTGESFKRTQKRMLLQDIQICNTPREYFMGQQPNPSDRFLSTTLLTQKMGRVFRRQLLNKDTFKRNNEQQIQQAFKDLFISMSADLIIIENVNQQEPLKVVIDGAATNKVQRLMIMPVQNKDGYPMRLPIKTFLPFGV